MQHVKNITVGFLISFLGSIPLGFLNVIGFDIYSQNGLPSTLYFLLGVILVEMLVIFLTLIFAEKLAANKKLTMYIEGFSVVFILILAYVFYAGADSGNQNRTVFANIGNSYFLAGLFFSAINFIQIPFWTGWNLYLINGKYIEVSNSRKYFYVFGTIAGTFCGMLALILALHYFAANVEFLSKYLMKIIIPLVFAGLGIFHGIQFFRKYRR